ncbi:MAG: class I SAM-dependent methyltransferase [Kofleriaceae bacterium]|nr:MAG: class I SAM-dependent methyltransferase [Kofleriaceae bacterium]
MRSLFGRLQPHRLVPRALVSAARQWSYLMEMSDWIGGHRANDLDVGYDRFQLFGLVAEEERLDREPIEYLEFGTAGGVALRWWLERNQHPDSRFHSFDTFTGLPEDWGGIKAGTFSQGGNTPDVGGDARVSFHVGLFNRTLPGHLRTPRPSRRLVIHVDPDLYSSTLYVLTMLAPLMRAGDILLMADFCSMRHPTHVFRAFHDFVSAYGLEYDVLASSNFGHQMVARIAAAPVDASSAPVPAKP